jgi:hypothetical protein
MSAMPTQRGALTLKPSGLTENPMLRREARRRA